MPALTRILILKSLALGMVLFLSISAAAPQEQKPAADEKPKLDAYGDPLPAGAIARLGTLRMRHQGAVDAVVYSPDGKTVASAGQDKSIRLWDVATGKEVRRIAADARYLAISPNGQHLAGSSGGVITVWDLATGGIVCSTRRGGCYSLAYSPDGTILASGATLEGSWGAVFLEASTLKEVRRFTGHQQPVQVVRFSKDGKLFASAGGEVGGVPGDTSIRIWDAATGREMQRLSGHGKAVKGLAFAPDGRTVVTGSFDALCIWDVETGKQLRKVEEQATALAFAPDGKTFIWGSFTGYLACQDLSTGKNLRFYEGHGSGVTSVAIAPDGRSLASGGDVHDCTVRLWNYDTARPSLVFVGHNWQVRALAYTPDGRLLVSGGGDNRVLVWNTSTHQLVRELAGKADVLGSHINLNAYITSIAISPDGKLVAAARPGHGVVTVWELASGEELSALKPPHAGMPCIAFSPDGKTLATCGGSFDKVMVCLWDVATGQPVAKLKPEGERIQRLRCCAFSPDGKWLAAGHTKANASLGSGAAITLWDVKRQMVSHKVEVAGFDFVGLAFSPDSRLLAGVQENSLSLRLFQAAQGTEVFARVEKSGELAQHVVFSPNGAALATTGHQESALRFWDPSSGKLHGRLTGHEPGRFNGFLMQAWMSAFTPDGLRIATGGLDSTILIWESPSYAAEKSR